MLIISNLEYNFFQIETTRVQRESLLYLWILDIKKTNENRGGRRRHTIGHLPFLAGFGVERVVEIFGH